MADALYKKGVINTSNLLLLLKQKSCDIEQMSCMYGYCETCKDVCFTENKIDSNMEIEWFQWVSKKEKRIVRSEEKEITITMKEQTKGTVGNLLDLFTDQMVRFKIHSFNIGNQLKHYRLTKENLQENEALLHIDFAENFQTKLSREIQSMHFGASQSNYNSHRSLLQRKQFSLFFCDCIRLNGSQPPCNLGLFGASS